MPLGFLQNFAAWQSPLAGQAHAAQPACGLLRRTTQAQKRPGLGPCMQRSAVWAQSFQGTAGHSGAAVGRLLLVVAH